MERIVDKMAVFVCCAALVPLCLAAYPEAFDITMTPTALALALACTAICDATGSLWRFCAPVAFCIFAIVFPSGAFFLPMAFYDLMRCIHHPAPLRFAIALGCATLVAYLVECPGYTAAFIALAGACAFASVLSFRTNRMVAKWEVARRLRDDLKARTLQLSAEKSSLERRLSEETSLLEEKLARTGGERMPGKGAARPTAFACLTEREYEVAQLVAQGLDNREIAATAYLGEGTVRNYISNILSKMELKNRTQIAVEYYLGIIGKD